MADKLLRHNSGLPSVCVDVVEKGEDSRPGWWRCVVGEDLRLNTSNIESYFLVPWDPVLYDAFVVAGAVEFCDRIKRRSARGWGRYICLNIPVYESERWAKASVTDSLRDALEFLTGDCWNFTFHRCKKPLPQRQHTFDFDYGMDAVVPFSEGLDSTMAARLAAARCDNRVVRVHLGPKRFLSNRIDSWDEPFVSVPYSVPETERRHREFSMRSRGFKFALASGIAAFLCGAQEIIVPESGQGAFGPSLITASGVHPDYRNHPRFGEKMEKFLRALLEFNGRYCYPHIWSTKGETLARFVKLNSSNTDWRDTRTCWQSRYVSVNKEMRQCGICSACMLRRMSVHAAQQEELPDTYVWENLSASTFESGVSPDFDREEIFGAMKRHAIDGIISIDRFARLLDSAQKYPSSVDMGYTYSELSRLLEISCGSVEKKMKHLLTQHKDEWENFMAFLGPTSFVTKWVHEVRS